MSWSKRLHWTLGVVGITGSAGFLIHFSGQHAFRAPPVSLVAIVASAILCEILCRAERLRRACQVGGETISRKEGFWINAVGDFFAAITPAGLGGEVSRAAALSRLKVGASRAVMILAGEGLVDHVSLGILMGLIFLILSRGKNGETPLLPSFLYAIVLYIGLTLGFLVVLIGIIRLRKIPTRWRDFLARRDLLVLTILHHLIRIGLLPLILYAVDQRIPLATTFFWSFILIYGLAIVPIPSGGGSVELAFVAAIGPLLEPHATGPCLVWWRLASHYFYVVLGGLATAASPLIVHRSHPPAPPAQVSTLQTAVQDDRKID